MRTGSRRVDSRRSTPARFCCHGGGQSIWSFEPRGGGRRWDGRIRGYPGGRRVNQPLVEMEIVVRAHTMINCRADMVPHGRNLNIVAAVGAFDSGQEAHVHGRHPESIQSRSRAQRGVHRGFVKGSRPKLGRIWSKVFQISCVWGRKKKEEVVAGEWEVLRSSAVYQSQHSTLQETRPDQA